MSRLDMLTMLVDHCTQWRRPKHDKKFVVEMDSKKVAELMSKNDGEMYE